MIRFEIDNPELFDELAHKSEQDVDGVINVVTKKGVTENGRSGVVIAFKAYVNGKLCRVHTTTTARELNMALGGLQAVVEMEDEEILHG